MATDSASLLSLDTFASKESLRVASYSRALQFTTVSGVGENVSSVAERFFDFVGNDRWRLEALDIVLRFSSRRDGVERLLEKAEQIAVFVKNPPAPKPPAKAEAKPKATSKKFGGQKK